MESIACCTRDIRPDWKGTHMTGPLGKLLVLLHAHKATLKLYLIGKPQIRGRDAMQSRHARLWVPACAVQLWQQVLHEQ